ncbi:MAG TPA: phosphoglycerate kinase [Candidatus Dormibacteraeota bacterium]|nr:phosphoglycerate kinase [Candidatus Dormibacteraeota bacterium]
MAVTPAMLPPKAGIDALPLEGRRVLVREDFNVPIDDQGRIRDDLRIRLALPTLLELRRRGARVICLTHLGRPRGHPDDRFTVSPVAQRLGELLGAPVQTAPDCIGPVARHAVEALAPGEVLLLENVRFHAGEEANDPAFAAELAALGEVFVNDAFGAAHRAHASTVGIASFLPALAGRLMEAELTRLNSLFEDPARPLIAVVGGSKLSTKVGLLLHLMDRLDGLFLGGAMAATFFRAAGRGTGTSLVEEAQIDQAQDVVAAARARGVDLRLPVDVVVAPGPDAPADQIEVRDAAEIPPDLMMLDVGPQTVATWGAALAAAGTVVWNGPLGLYERAPFRAGTEGVARAVIAGGATSICGGGDLAAALRAAGLADGFTHVSSGGGATLTFLEGKVLPAVAVLRDRATLPAPPPTR